MNRIIIDTSNLGQYLKLGIKIEDRKRVPCELLFSLGYKEDPTLLTNELVKYIYKQLIRIRNNFKQMLMDIFRTELPPIRNLIIRIVDSPTKFINGQIDNTSLGRMCFRHHKQIHRNWKWNANEDVLVYVSIPKRHIELVGVNAIKGLLFHEIGHIYQIYWMIQHTPKIDKKIFHLTHIVIDAITNCRFKGSYCKDSKELELLRFYMKHKQYTIYNMFQTIIDTNIKGD